MRNNLFLFISISITTFIIISCESKTQNSSAVINTVIDTLRTVELPADTNEIVLSAVELTAEYVANEVKADHDYKGKEITVKGTVTDISKGIGGDIFIVLKGSEKSRSVQCYYADEEDAQTLKKGMTVFFKGKCDGLWVNVILNKCKRVGEFLR